MKCKHCDRPIRKGLLGYEHNDGFIVCITVTETTATPKDN